MIVCPCRPLSQEFVLHGLGRRNLKLWGWDGWPDGMFEHLFTFEELESYNNLLVHWATKSRGVRGGNDFAEEWVDGKRLRRDCFAI
jgi:hypothetical protein